MLNQIYEFIVHFKTGEDLSKILETRKIFLDQNGYLKIGKNLRIDGKIHQVYKNLLAKHGVNIRSILLHEGLMNMSEKFKLLPLSITDVIAYLSDALKYIDFKEKEEERMKLNNDCYVNNSKRAKQGKQAFAALNTISDGIPINNFQD